MTPEGKDIAVIGLFDDSEALLEAAARVRDAEWLHWDCHAPYPVHGLDDAMGLRESWIPWLTISAGICGAVFGKAMQWYMSDFDFPLIIGGKPLFSLPAFIPVTFELFVLFAALTTFAGILWLCKLGRWRSPLHEAGAMREVTGNRFAVVLGAESDEVARDARDERDERDEGEGETDEEKGERGERRYTVAAARGMLEECGCKDIRVVVDGNLKVD